MTDRGSGKDPGISFGAGVLVVTPVATASQDGGQITKDEQKTLDRQENQVSGRLYGETNPR